MNDIKVINRETKEFTREDMILNIKLYLELLEQQIGSVKIVYNPFIVTTKITTLEDLKRNINNFAKKEKLNYCIIEIINRRTDYRIFCNLEDAKSYFSYTIDVGNSYNKKIKKITEIKTIKSFVSNLQKAYEEKECACYNRTWVRLIKI